MFRTDNDNRKRKEKKKHIRKLKDFLGSSDPHLEETTQEKKRVPVFSGNYLRQQYRNQDSEQLFKDRKPSGACDNKKYGFIPSSEYVKGKRPQDVCRTPSYSERHFVTLETTSKCLCTVAQVEDDDMRLPG